MANAASLPQLIVPAAPIHELLNVDHSRPFSLLFGNYSLMLGIAGGLTLIWAIYVLAGRRRGVEFRFAMPMAVSLIVAGFLNVLSEVHQPSRLLYGYFTGWQNWDTSIIKYGIILLPVYLVLCWWLTFQAMDRAALDRAIERLAPGTRTWADVATLWSRHYSLLERADAHRGIWGLLVFLSLFAPTYSGIFLMDEHGVALWNSVAPVLLFLASGLACGALLMIAALPALGRLATGHYGQPSLRPLRWTVGTCVVAEAVVWFGWLGWMARFGTVDDLRAVALYTGPYAHAISLNWTWIGIVLPLLVVLTPLWGLMGARWLAMLGAVWGGYALRMIILIGGQALIRSGAGFEAFAPSAETMLSTVFSILAFIGLLALLLLAMPIDRAPELDPTSGH